MRLPTHRSPLHLSEILPAKFMQPYNLIPSMLAEAIGLSVEQIAGIIHAQKPIIPEIALRLSFTSICYLTRTLVELANKCSGIFGRFCTVIKHWN
jgi:hypothetical protein